jgi:hypothetical protein
MHAALLIAALLTAQTPNRVIWVGGQSLSQGADTAVTVVQTRGNKMIDGMSYNGVSYVTDVPSPAWPLTDLIEVSTESPRTSMANEYYDLTGYPVVVAIGSKGGSAYTTRAVGTEPFINATDSIQGVAEHATCAHVVGAVDIGGETDQQLNVTRVQMAANMVEHQAAIQSAARARMPLTGTVHLCVQQLSSWTSAYSGGLTTSTVAMGQHDAAVASDVIEISHAGFAAPYMVDTIHHTAAGSILDGVYLARCVAGGASWHPVRPSSAVRTGNTIHVEFYVPTPPLLIDESDVTDPGDYGFDVQGGGSIVSVTLSASGTGVDIVVSGATTYLGIGRVGTTLSGGSQTAGPRSPLQDSADPPNFAIHSETAVTS